jgi:hypothetical protein
MWRRFLIWLSVLATVWLLANWPRGGGSLKSSPEWAGFPWTFAFWEDGRLVWFKGAALVADLGVLLALTLVAWLCAWSRGSLPRQTAAGAVIHQYIYRGGRE